MEVLSLFVIREPRFYEYECYIPELCLFDDDFMSLVLDDIDCVELILRIILDDQDIRISRVLSQKEVKNIKGKSIRADIIAEGIDGTYYNIEVQRENSGGIARRARYNSSMVDMSVLEPGNQYSQLPKVHTIFIMERDIFHQGLPLYHCQRMIEEMDEPLNDGSYIIYVNGSRCDDTRLGRLMHDFHCQEWREMDYPELARRVRYYKEKEGREKMCEVWERIKRDGFEQGIEYGMTKGMETNRIISIQNLMKNLNLNIEEAMKALNIPETEQQYYIKILN